MAKNRKRGGGRDRESMNSGEMGKRNRNTPGRSVSELGVDEDTAHGQNVLGASAVAGGGRPGVSDDATTGGPSGTRPEGGSRRNPPLVTDATFEDGGISQSGGVAGGERGHGGTSNRGAGGPLGDTRGGPGEYKGTSRGDLDHGTVDRPDTTDSER